MKRVKAKRIAALTAILGVAILATGCGASNVKPGPGGDQYPLPGGGGCIPLNSPQGIPFTATGAQLANGKLIVGNIPPNPNGPAQSVGQVLTGGTPIPAGQLNGSGPDGSIHVNVSGNGTLSGTVRISAFTLNHIQTLVQAGHIQIPSAGLPADPGQICVSQIAIQLNVTHPQSISNPNWLYAGDVYLYLNNTDRGYAMFF